MNKYLLKCSSLIIYLQVEGAPPSSSWSWPWPRRNIFVPLSVSSSLCGCPPGLASSAVPRIFCPPAVPLVYRTKEMKRGDRRGDWRFEEARPPLCQGRRKSCVGNFLCVCCVGLSTTRDRGTRGGLSLPLPPKETTVRSNRDCCTFHLCFSQRWGGAISSEKVRDNYCSGAGSLVLSKDDQQ